MASGYAGGYGSDWTRPRRSFSRSRVGTDLDLNSEVGTTLSSTAAPAPRVQRLSFARHPSVIGSSLNPTPLIEKIVRPVNQSSEQGLGFRALAQPIAADAFNSQSHPNIDVQAILDGSTRKPLGSSDFKRFLNHIRRGGYKEESQSWIKCAPVMVEFLLEFKSYAERFSKLSLLEQSQSPHPFEIVCFLNAQAPQSPNTSEAHFHDSHHSDVSCNPFIDIEAPNDNLINASAPEKDASSPIQLSPPVRQQNRKVNWAPSVQSHENSHHELDGPGSTLSTTLHEASILRAARVTSRCYSSLSAADLTDALRGIKAQNQLLRSVFDALVEKYLSQSTSKAQGGLLLQCAEIKNEYIQRAVLEGRYTNHPAVLSGVVAEILEGLNEKVLPVFKTYATTEQTNKQTAPFRTIWGSLLILFTLCIHLLMIIVPSPLMAPLHIKARIPIPYRLLLLPMIWLGFVLIMSDRLHVCCLLHWSHQSHSRNCSSAQDDSVELNPNELERQNHAKPCSKTNSGRFRSTSGEQKHRIITWIASSLVLALAVEVILILVPFLQ